MCNFCENNISEILRNTERLCFAGLLQIFQFHRSECNASLIPIVKWETFYSDASPIVLLLHLFVNANAKRFHIQCKLSSWQRTVSHVLSQWQLTLHQHYRVIQFENNPRRVFVNIFLIFLANLFLKYYKKVQLNCVFVR